MGVPQDYTEAVRWCRRAAEQGDARAQYNLGNMYYNGMGVPQRLRRKIFGRFVRLGLELEREKPGTGLGLHIVQTLVRRMGGRVRVRDVETGSGAVFEVELPASRVIAAETPPWEER